ncbi:MAG: IPTL-CTERM sorting domain-containing protein, partial [Planctomycetota bacterium]
VDADDAARFETCFTGANGGPIDPGCEPGDFDLDNDADCDDWAQFGLVWTGPGQPPQLTQCSSASIPTVSHWGLVTLTLLLLTAGTVVTRQTRRGGTADRVCATAL